MTERVVVVGGGLIGLSCAWRSAERGLDVTLVDDDPGSGASGVAAGMLAPVTEVTYGEEQLLRLGIASVRRWERFAADLEAASDTDVAYRPEGTLLVAFDDDDRRALADLAEFMGELGLGTEPLRSRACRDREPLLSPRIRGGVLAAEDHSVDPRRVIHALEVAGRREGVEVVAARAEGIVCGGGRVVGVELQGGHVVAADRVVLAAGVWTGGLEGLPPGTVPAVRPVKGQLLRLRTPEDQPRLNGAVRAVVRGRSVYLVPRDDGEVVLGATQEERGHDTAVTAGGMRELLDDAVRVVPGVDELELAETQAGLRPGTADNRPLIGATSVDGLLLATGHFRNGVLLTPITADAIADLLTGEEPEEAVAVADPDRPGLRSGGTSGTVVGEVR